MKITVNEKPAAPKYPCLMATADGEVVLFSAYGDGVVVSGGRAGYQSVLWTQANFTPFTGSITLSNN